MLNTVEVDVVTCDGCGSQEFIIEETGVPEGWYFGEVTYGSTGKPQGGDWHACKSAHIKKAIMVAAGQVEKVEG